MGPAVTFAAVSGTIQAFDMPARQTFVSEMVPRHLIPNAIGLNSTQFNAARLVGPGIAGLVIAGVGVGPALLVNAISFAAVLAGLLLMRPDELLRSPKARERGAIIGGIRYVAGRHDIIAVMVIVATLSMFGMQFPLTNALMATTEFGKGAGEFGILGSAMAIGTFAAALLAAKRARPRFRTTLLALAGFAVSMALASMAPSYTTYLLLLVPMGLCAITVLTNCNAMVQMTAAPEFRGRALSVYLAVNMGGSPIGALLLGRLCDIWGARAGLAIGAGMTGLVALAVGAWLMRRDGIQLHLDRYWPPLLEVRNRAVEQALALEGTPAEPGVGTHA